MDGDQDIEYEQHDTDPMGDFSGGSEGDDDR